MLKMAESSAQKPEVRDYFSNKMFYYDQERIEQLIIEQIKDYLKILDYFGNYKWCEIKTLKS